MIEATSLADLNDSAYNALQDALKNLAQRKAKNLQPVEYDDILWRLLNK